MLDQASDQHRLQFFEKKSLMGQEQWVIRQESSGQTSRHPTPQSAEDKQSNEIIVPSEDPIASLTEVIKAETNRKKKYPPSETGNSPNNYQLFVDLIYRMLAFDPKHRIRPGEALKHPFITAS
jgi:serine/threonine protein kinase